MISKEEMYEFASLIAGITDADLEAYRGGGKTTKRKVVSSKGKPAWVAPAGPIAGKNYYESGTVENESMTPNGIRMEQLPNRNWVLHYPNGSTRTYKVGDPDFEYVNRIATKNLRQSQKNLKKNGISLDQEKCGGKMKKHK